MPSTYQVLSQLTHTILLNLPEALEGILERLNDSLKVMQRQRQSRLPEEAAWALCVPP